MIKERKTSIIFTTILAAVAILIISGYAVMQLKESGKIGSPESQKIMNGFNKYFNSNKRTVIYYESSGCGYCELETPILETIADDYNMDYYNLDSSKLSNSQRKEVLKKLGIEHATPTTVVVENGKVIDKNVGYTAGKEYVEFFVKTKILPKDAEYSAEKNITYIDYAKYNKLITNDDTHVIVIGQTTCSHCIAIKPALNTIATEYNLTINYLNLTEMSEEQSNSLFASLKEIGYDDPDFLKDGSFGTPLTLIIKNGKVSNYISGERTTSQLVREFTRLGLITE